MAVRARHEGPIPTRRLFSAWQNQGSGAGGRRQSQGWDAHPGASVPPPTAEQSTAAPGSTGSTLAFCCWLRPPCPQPWVRERGGSQGDSRLRYNRRGACYLIQELREQRGIMSLQHFHLFSSIVRLGFFPLDPVLTKLYLKFTQVYSNHANVLATYSWHTAGNV